MNTRNKKPKRIVAAVLTSLFLTQQSMLLSVIASEISGINGNNGVYNINPTAMIPKTDIGYRKYKDFVLDKDDVANLIFKYGNNDINTFLNLVDNQININGLVNTMRDGNFYNGKAVFVSPKGMVVGSSGVLNVGSLSVYTPTQATYVQYRSNPTADYSGLANSNNGQPITINGKVLAANDVELKGGKVTIAQNAGIVAGVNESALNNLSKAQAQNLFDTLVNTNNIRYFSKNGNITIETRQTDTVAGVDIQGTMRNLGNGDINIRNNGSEGVKIAGNVINVNGNTTINNYWNDLNISGNVKNAGGKVNITNAPAENGTRYNVDGNVYDYTISKETELNISGNVLNDGETNLSNSGNKGLNITSSGRVNATDNVNI